MQGLGWIAAVIVGGLAGWAASTIMKADTGIFTNILLGIVGAIVANFIAGALGISFAPRAMSQGLAGLIGACLLIAGVRALRR
ncbi:MAG: GlsB/YeaQ/YmgE family stress response membrane protein [Pseudomonadota bacterium]